MAKVSANNKFVNDYIAKREKIFVSQGKWYCSEFEKCEKQCEECNLTVKEKLDGKSKEV